MTQQTAVQYLLEKLYTEYRFEFSGTIVDQAKQMEKEQIIDAFDCDSSPQPGEEWISNGEQYYNEKYNK